jgi:hypothetical protein
MHGESVDNMASASETSRGIHITPGNGIVAHLGLFMAYAEGDDDGLNQLVVRLNALAGAPWAEVVRTLTSDISAAGYDNHPALACATIDGDRIGVLVFGDLTLSVTTDQEQRVLDGRHSSTWIDLSMPGTTQRVRCGEQSSSNVVGVLRDGVVSGGGFVFDLSGPIPAATRWDADEAAGATPAPETAASDATDTIAVPVADDTASPEAEEAEVVEAVETPVAEEAEVADAPIAEADATEEIVEPDDIVEAHTLNGNIFGSPVDTDDELEDPAGDAPEAETTESDDASNDFPAVAGIFSRSEPDSIDDAEVVDTSDEIAGVVLEETDPVDGIGSVPLHAVEPLEDFTAPTAEFAPAEEDLPPPPVPAAEEAEASPSPVAVATVPELHGVLCPSGHLTSVQDETCRTCGLPIDPTAEIVVGPRPSLGTLTFDDGAQLQLTRPVVIGRGVPERYAINGEPATTVLLDDVQGTISRVHLEVHLVGWEIEIIDMNSTSGTFTRLGDERIRLLPDDATAISPGTVVEVGQRSFTFSAGPNPPV